MRNNLFFNATVFELLHLLLKSINYEKQIFIYGAMRIYDDGLL